MDMLCISAEGCLSTNLTLSLVPHQWDLEHKGNSSGLTSAFLGKCKMGDDYKLLCFHCSSIQCSVWKTNCTHWNVLCGLVLEGAWGRFIHPDWSSLLVWDADAGSWSQQLSRWIHLAVILCFNQLLVSSWGALPVKTLWAKNRSGSWKFFKRSFLDQQNKCG